MFFRASKPVFSCALMSKFCQNRKCLFFRRRFIFLQNSISRFLFHITFQTLKLLFDKIRPHYLCKLKQLPNTVYFSSASWETKSMCVLSWSAGRSETVWPLISAVQVDETMTPSMESYRPEAAQTTGFTPFSMTTLESTDLYCLRLAYTFK